MDRARVVLIFGKNHNFLLGLDDFERAAIQEETGQSTARVVLDIPQGGSAGSYA